jgi:hypothetical protein
MTELPISSKYRSTPEVPVSADERDQLTQRLNDAFAAGRLEQSDYSTRMDRLYAAEKLGELVPVVEGLPAQQVSNDPAMAKQGAGAPGELAPSRDARRLSLVAIGAVAAIVILLAILLVILI